ncbi:putative RNAse P Rpr2/Rpp21/SNM1 subunit domain [Monocercomonoides exilis]|uniref:putative RNAse P Rpr2/Rpp21/SNM1 subunit domain n=1 Tax=Monocercomonoides exilis TaxID=2049356 RepID=UPI00355A0B75|nr:putative RNAse P Rpr2/Rpp21/SNM1 subunit domain [Monocercomonoides exilis]
MVKKNRSQRSIEHLEYINEIAHVVSKFSTSLSRIYVAHLKRSASKILQNLGTEIKQSFCKRCNTVFVEGVNCDITMKEQCRIYKCKTCGYIRKINLNKPLKKFPTTLRKMSRTTKQGGKDAKEKESKGG